MLPLSEELRGAIAELRTWAALHRATNEPGIAGALGVVEKSAAFIARAEKTHPHSPSVLLVFSGVVPQEGPGGMAEAIFDHYAAQARASGVPEGDPIERHVPLLSSGSTTTRPSRS